MGFFSRATDPFNISGNNGNFRDSADALYLFHQPKDQIDPGITSGQNTIAGWMRRDWDRFTTDYTPLLNHQMASLKDNSLVERAETDAPAIAERDAAMSARATARRGLALTQDQSEALTRRRSLATATQTADMVNNARLNQRDRNEATASNLANFGADMRNQAMDNMLNGMGIASNRAANNRQAAANARAQNQQTAAAVASIAVMM